MFCISPIAKIEHCFRDINVIARIANCTRKINVQKFKQFCKEAYVFKVQAFDWPSCTVSLHRGYAHLADIISLNDSLGLGDISESCMEASHKILRLVSKHMARQNDNSKNAHDCFNHLWLMSDPIVRSETEENSDSDIEIQKDGDDPIVESFFIVE